jgi:hypothetical protein
MNPASLGKQITHSVFPLAASPVTATLAVIALFGFASTPMSRAAVPESELKATGAIPLTTELLDKMEKIFTSVRSDSTAKAELAAVKKENQGNPPMTGEAWSSLISAKCPKALEIFKASGLTVEEFGKAAFAAVSLSWIDGLATPEDKDNLAKSEDKTVAANVAFFAANKSRVEAIYANFMVMGDTIEN